MSFGKTSEVTFGIYTVTPYTTGYMMLRNETQLQTWLSVCPSVSSQEMWGTTAYGLVTNSENLCFPSEQSESTIRPEQPDQ